VLPVSENSIGICGAPVGPEFDAVSHTGIRFFFDDLDHSRISLKEKEMGPVCQRMLINREATFPARYFRRHRALRSAALYSPIFVVVPDEKYLAIGAFAVALLNVESAQTVGHPKSPDAFQTWLLFGSQRILCGAVNKVADCLDCTFPIFRGELS